MLAVCTCVVVATLFKYVATFNFDTRYPVVYFDPVNYNEPSESRRTSYFGYSVLLYPYSAVGGPWIQIGAPRANSSKVSDSEPGEIFRCAIGGKCEIFQVDYAHTSRRAGRTERGHYIDRKVGAWIGVSMDIHLPTNRIVVCGHRWSDCSRGNCYPLGICYWTYENNTVPEILLPLVVDNYNLIIKSKSFYYAMGQAGISTYFSDAEIPELVLGAPGIYNWMGSTLVYRDGDNAESPISKRSNINAFSELFIPESTFTEIMHAHEYIGYEVLSGRFFSKEEIVYVAGSPRAMGCKGQILVFDMPKDQKPLEIKHRHEGSHLGEYFGAALGVGDINGDGLDDLLVGAPHFTSVMDEGRLYVFFGNSAKKLISPDKNPIIHGKVRGGRFGNAVMVLGDIDNDGYRDIAVSAPYEDEQRGVVYIYNGDPQGLSLYPNQKIEARSISGLLRGFGISLSRPIDIDGNLYDDIAVGAYKSGHAVLFRSFPVANIDLSVRSILPQLDHNTTNFTVETCWWYSGRNLPKTLSIKSTIKLDESHKRIYLLMNGTRKFLHGQNVTVHGNKSNCENLTIFIKTKIKNYLDPVEIILLQSLIEYKDKPSTIFVRHDKTFGDDRFCKFCPIMHPKFSKVKTRTEIPFALNCGNDNICSSDLNVSCHFIGISSNKTYVIGSENNLQLETIIRNAGEPAYLTQLGIFLPEKVHLLRIPPICHEEYRNSSVFILCDVENPLYSGQQKIITLDLDMKEISSVGQSGGQLNFTVEAKTKSDDILIEDNNTTLTLYLTTETDISITGNSHKDIYSYGNKTLNPLLFQHLFEVQKFGASPIEEVLLHISIPTSIKFSNREIQFLQIYEPTGYQAGQPFTCTSSNVTYIKFEEHELVEEVLLPETENEKPRHKRSTETTTDLQNKSVELPPTNRTLFLNCSMKDIVCVDILCVVGPFKRAQNVARLQIKMLLDVNILKSEVSLIKRKDIIYLSTDGKVLITKPAGIKQMDGERPDNIRISSTFIAELPENEEVKLWILIVAIVSGVLIFMLLVIGLIKAGFFQRKKKDELEALKNETLEEEFLQNQASAGSNEAILEDEDDVFA